MNIDPAVLTHDLGGAWYGTYGTAPCPVCQPPRRKDQSALTISAKGGKLLLHCKKWGCAFKDILIAAGITLGTLKIDHLAALAAERDRKEQAAKLCLHARSLWARATPIQGTKGESYLQSRGITCCLPDTIRWLPDTYHGPSGNYCAAMIADVAPTGGVHRTFFDKKGQRLNKSAKMMLGPCAGGAVRLSDSRGPLVVCEGVETGLSLLSGLLDGPHSVWAALSTSGMKALSLPPETGDLVIATDSDDSGAGKEAGDALARTAHGFGWDVFFMPAPAGMDWNDVLQRGVPA